MSRENEIDVLARTLYGESRGESVAGQQAVAWVIRNRVDAQLRRDGKPDWWGEGYNGVCRAPYQFSCWNRNDPNFPFLSGAKPIPERMFNALKAVAMTVIRGEVPDPTGGATHYYATTMPRPPAWVKGATFTVQIGAHRFYRNVP